MGVARQGLGEEVRQVVSGVNALSVDDTFFNFLSDEVVFNVNMLGLVVIFGVSRQFQGRVAINKQGNLLNIETRNSEIIDKVS